MAIGEITVQDVRNWWRKTKKRRSDDIALMCAGVVLDEYISEEVLEKNSFKLAKLSKSVKKTIKPLGEVEQHRDDISDGRELTSSSVSPSA